MRHPIVEASEDPALPGGSVRRRVIRKGPRLIGGTREGTGVLVGLLVPLPEAECGVFWPQFSEFWREKR